MANTKVISLRVEEDVLREIDGWAALGNRSRNWVVGMIFANWIGSETAAKEYMLGIGSGKKIADVSGGGGATEGVGAPNLPPMGKLELPDNFGKLGNISSPVAGMGPLTAEDKRGFSAETIQGLRDICAGNIHANHFAHDPDAEQAEVDLCGERFHSEVDGEWYMCGKEKHPFPKVKHGDWIKV